MDILNEERFEKGGVILERLHPELAIEPFIPYYERMGYNVTINKLPNGWTEIIGEKINKPDSDIVEYLQNHTKDEAYRLNNSNWNSRFISNAQYNVNRDYITKYAKGGEVDDNVNNLLKSKDKDTGNTFDDIYNELKYSDEYSKEELALVLLGKGFNDDESALYFYKDNSFEEIIPFKDLRKPNFEMVMLDDDLIKETDRYIGNWNKETIMNWVENPEDEPIYIYEEYAKGGEVCPTCGSFAKGGKIDDNVVFSTPFGIGLTKDFLPARKVSGEVILLSDEEIKSGKYPIIDWDKVDEAIDNNAKKFAKGGNTKSDSLGYNVFNYTDNIYATDEVFKTKTMANKFIKDFRRRFANQGYYRDNFGNKIKIEDIDL